MHFFLDPNISQGMPTHLKLSQKHTPSIYEMHEINKYYSRVVNDTHDPVIHINSNLSTPSSDVMTSLIPSTGINESLLSKYVFFS